MSEIELYYEEMGAGEPLILLHGNGESQEYFVHQKGVFARDFHVYALDTRGHGQSPRGTAEFSIVQFAEDLRDFMDERGITTANLLGFSDGGNIALTFALDYPERVTKLVLNGANLDPSGVKRSVQTPVEVGYRAASLLAKRSADAQKEAELLGLMVKEPRIAPEELANLTMPTLVIVGKDDMIKYEHSRLIYESLPSGRFVVLEGDHFVAAKRPAAFNDVVLRFLKG